MKARTGRRRDGRTARLLVRLGEGKVQAHSASFSADGGTLLLGTNEDLVLWVDARTGAPTATRLVTDSTPVDLQVSRAGELALARCRDGRVLVFDVDGGRLRRSLEVEELFLNAGFSLDGSRVLYLAAQDLPGVIELYSTPIDGSLGPVKLNAPLVFNRDVRHFQVTLDSSSVVYTADQDTAGRVELYTVPIDGGQTPMKLSGPLVSGGNVSPNYFVISPDSARVVYHADQEFDGVFELFSVPLSGGTPITAPCATS